MSPAEIMREHIEFWTSGECQTLSQEDVELVKRLAEVSGVALPQCWGKKVEIREAAA
jgi:hypothetical protein